MTPEEAIKAWDFLRSEIDAKVKRVLDKSVYGVAGLSDVPEWYLWERLEKSGLRWELDIGSVTYHGAETRTPASGGRAYQWYLVSVQATLIVDGRPFPCVGAGEGRRLDTAYKGALTSAFKNGCKWAGITMSIYKNAPIDDDYIGGEENRTSNTQSRSAAMATNSSQEESASSPPSNKTTSQSSQRSGITASEFESNPVNIVRQSILSDFNKALPQPHADTWVEAAINLWLSRSEQGELTEDMQNPKSGGSPINWVFHRLSQVHYQQCSSTCPHVGEFLQKLRDAKVPEE